MRVAHFLTLSLSFVALLQLDDAGKVASKQSQLCSSRLHYLAQVDHLLDLNKNHLQYEHAEDDNSDEGEKTADDDAQVTDGSQLPLKGDSSVFPSPASLQSMEVDSSPTSASNVTSLNKVASKKDNHSDSSEFEVTPRVRLDRLFADYLLRNSQFHKKEDEVHAAAFVLPYSHFFELIVLLCVPLFTLG